MILFANALCSASTILVIKLNIGGYLIYALDNIHRIIVKTGLDLAHDVFVYKSGSDQCNPNSKGDTKMLYSLGWWIFLGCFCIVASGDRDFLHPIVWQLHGIILVSDNRIHSHFIIHSWYVCMYRICMSLLLLPGLCLCLEKFKCLLIWMYRVWEKAVRCRLINKASARIEIHATLPNQQWRVERIQGDDKWGTKDAAT